MRRISVFALVVVFVACASVAQDNWYPSRWGAADQRGAANRITPAKVLEAKNLITRGTVYQLGHVYETAMPMFGTRHYSLRIPQGFGPMGTNQTVYHDEIVSGELGQIGTQFDGLGHIGVGDLFYNGHNRREFAKAEGLDEARHRERRRHRHPGRADRRGRVQGCADAGRGLRDHAGGRAGSAEASRTSRFAPATSSCSTRAGARSG